MKQEKREYCFVRRNGKLELEAGSIMEWAPSSNDPIGGYGESDPALDREIVAFLETIPLDKVARARIDNTPLSRYECNHVRRLVSVLNEHAGFIRFTCSVSDSCISIRRHEQLWNRDIKPTLSQRETKIKRASRCPLCNMHTTEERYDLGEADLAHWSCYAKKERIQNLDCLAAFLNRC